MCPQTLARVLFVGERDENVDCMNRVLDVSSQPNWRGLDGLSAQWNHDEFGYMKLSRYLPARVNDVLRYHSLRELRYLVTPSWDPYIPDTPLNLDMKVRVTRKQAAELAARMDPSDVERAQFVANFAYFDAQSKMETDEIPIVDVQEVQQLIFAYFPDGKLEW